MMPAHFKTSSLLTTFCLLCLLVLTSCELVAPSPATPIPTVTPPSDMLSLTAAQFRYTLEDNRPVPGTDIIFRSRDNDSIVLEIEGQPAVRRVGDYLNGADIMVPGVLVEYSLRLVNATFANPYIVGPVTMTIFNPAPVEIPGLAGQPVGAKIVYDGINIDYRIPVNRQLPGSTVTYLGQNDFGAILGGTSQYSSLPQNNSFVWTGRLHSYAIIQYDLTATSVTADELRMQGTAKLYLYDKPLIASN